MLLVNVVRWTTMSTMTSYLLCLLYLIGNSVSQNIQNINVKSNNSGPLLSEKVTELNSSDPAVSSVELDLHNYETFVLKEDVANKRVLDLSTSDGSNSARMDDLIKKFGSDYFLKEDDTNSSIDATTVSGLRKNGVIQKLSKPVTQKPQIIEEEESLGERVLEALKDPEIQPQTGVEWLLDVYNPHRWRPNLLPGARRLSKECKQDMKIYLTALTNGSIWAAKMTDASGRYSSQFFFGNDFWLGSHTLCQELQNTATNKIVPPYQVYFHVAKLQLSLHHDLTPTNRQISLGVCLPKTCKGTDISAMLQPDTSPAKVPHTIQVLKVRPIPGEYSLLKDKKFHFLLTVVGILWFCVAIGTGYETIVERRQRRLEKRTSVVNNNEEERSSKFASPLTNIAPIKVTKMGDKDQLNSSGSDISTEDCFRVPMSMFGQVLLSFSALSNGRKILDAGAAPKDSLTCVHGLRFFSLAWVIMVHTYLQVFAIAENKTLRTLTERNFMFQTVSNATFSVDTFFFISGLLVTYLYYKTLRVETSEQKLLRRRRDKQSQIKSGATRFFTLLGYRFIRLTPAYLFVLVVAELNMRWIRNNSVFEPVNRDEINCDLYWWRNALYINSLYPMKDMCMLWSWYLANDTQFYALGIILLLVSVSHFRVAVAGMFVFLVSSWVTTATISIRYSYKVRVEYPFALFDEIYDKPWTRLGPYLVGMFVGWFLFKTKCKIHISKFTVVSGWFLSLLVLISLVYGVLNAQLGVHATAVYTSLGHTAWGMALAWIVIACCSGYGGYINSLLSCRLLHPLSRLTYCAYLIHPVIMVLTSFQMDGPLHLHNGLVLVLYFGNVVAAFILSFLISMTFEAPIVRLLKVALSPRPRRTSPSTPE